MASYRLLVFGVRNEDTGVDIMPGGPGWDDYLAFVDAGGVPLPLIVPTPPPPTQDELDALAELQEREAIAADLASRPIIQQLRKRTPAEVDDWIQANVTDLASAKVVLRILAYVVALLARERIRNA